MAVDDKKQPIVIKKIKKAGEGHHGGAWKVAYADFVTAMMAFFLLLWLLGITSQQDREVIADIFEAPSVIEGPGGASTSMIQLGGAMEMPKGEGEPLKETPKPPKPDSIPSEELSEMLEEAAKLDRLMQRIKQQIEETPTMIAFKDQLKLDITSEGLRIQIVDQENRPMFDLGRAHLKDYTKEILHELAKTITEVPNHISVTGHTDATTFYGERPNYSNWELSADRANAARRELKVGGMDDERFGRVVGLASSVLFDKDNPAAPINRRISIVVLNRATEKAIGLTEGGTLEEEVKPEPETNEGGLIDLFPVSEGASMEEGIAPESGAGDSEVIDLFPLSETPPAADQPSASVEGGETPEPGQGEGEIIDLFPVLEAPINTQ